MADSNTGNLAQSGRSVKKKYSSKGRHRHADTPSISHWKESHSKFESVQGENSAINVGWGNLIFANTFEGNEKLVERIKSEKSGQRNIAFYAQDPQITVSEYPNDVFMDPSYTYRIWFEKYKQSKRLNSRIFVRRLNSVEDLDQVNHILMARRMVTLNKEAVLKEKKSKKAIHLVAESQKTGEIVGYVTGVDHKEVFDDPEKGSSLWSLAVHPNSMIPGIGEALTRYLIEYFIARGNSYLDLSVIHGNKQAITLYKKLKFEKVPVYCLKKKNSINESLYTSMKKTKHLNPYAQIIVDEAARRGIEISFIDKKMGYFRLSLGARSVVCRESLTDQTSAIAMSQCADKRMTSKVLKSHKISVPDQMTFNHDLSEAYRFLEKHKQIVVKPADGEQGQGVKVGIRSKQDLKKSLESLKGDVGPIIIEEMVSGYDVRVIVIDYQFVAAALRRPPEILGNGVKTVKQLILALNRRRMAATGGESQVPFDDETLRTLKEQKLTLDSVLKDGRIVQVRKTANVHTGGTIEDITPQFSDFFKKVSVEAAISLGIPVVGLDLMIPSFLKNKYWIIEANERPGLANHEPQPTAQAFIDFLFPQTRKEVSNYENPYN